MIGSALAGVIGAAGRSSGPPELLLFREQFDAGYWNKQNASVTPNATQDPNGNPTADLYLPSTANTAFHSLYVQQTLSGRQYRYSVYAKAGGYQYLMLAFVDNTYKTAVFDLSAGSVTQTPAGCVTPTPVAAGNGWYKCELQFTPLAGTVFLYLGSASSASSSFGATSYAGDGTSGTYLWRASLL